MKVDDKFINYAIGKQHPKSTQNLMEKCGEDPLTDKPMVPNKDRSGQDTIVRLSAAIKEAQLIKVVIASGPDIRGDKVLELKQRIESNKYRIDPEAVAGKLVNAFVAAIS